MHHLRAWFSSALLAIFVALGALEPSAAAHPYGGASAGGASALEASAATSQAPFQASAGELTLAPGGQGALTFTISVPPGTLLYRDMIEVRVLDSGDLSAGEPSLPPALKKQDPVLGVEREVYDLDVLIEIPVKAPAGLADGARELLVEATWQGCRGTLCFMPQTATLAAPVTVSATGARLSPLPGVLGALIPTARAADGEDEPVSVEVKAKDDTLLVSFDQKKGWHLTQMMTFIELAEGQAVALGEQRWPEAHQRPDPAIPGATRGEFDGDFTVTSDLHGPKGKQTITGTVGYQACKAERCLLPQYHDFELSVLLTKTSSAGGDAPEGAPEEATPGAAPVEASAAPAAPSGTSAIDAAAEKGMIWLVLFVMGAGFLVSLTPCVLPMIPVTMGIIGATSEGNRLRGFLLSLTYVAGLATVYTSLGVVAAYSGSLFGGHMQSPWLVGAISLFFVAMGFSMFGYFDVAVPSSIATKLSQKGGAGFVGAFVVGAVGGVVAGPCSGPVIASLMVLIGQQGAVLLGVALMLAFSLGMGILFLIAGTFSGAMVQPGMWMDTVKKGFGIVLWLAAIYYIAPHLSDSMVALSTALVLLSTAVFGWPTTSLEDSMEGETLFKLRQLYGVISGLVGGWLLVGTLMVSGFILPAMTLGGGGGGAALADAGPAWLADEPSALVAAQEAGQPVIVDFTADWCAACKELEHFTYTDPEVVARFGDFVPVMIDATSAKDPEVERLMKKYGVLGLPTVKFLDPQGNAFEDLTVTEYIPADKFLPLMESALARSK